MAWERRKRGPGTGYYYQSVRTVAGTKKVYYGRRTAGQLMAAGVEQRREGRRLARELVRAERENAAEEDRLAAELRAWADVLSAAWLIVTGHRRRGQWRKKRA